MARRPNIAEKQARWLAEHPKPITLPDLSRKAAERSEATPNTTGEQHD